MSASEGTSVRKHSMVETKSRWKSVAGREKWAARGASLVAKTKATKVVWFPPKPAATGKKTGSTAKRATKRATKKATRAAKKAPGATRKTTNSTEKVTSPVRRKKA